jgi:glycosyltransferase involved in cell wall biosynthesis
MVKFHLVVPGHNAGKYVTECIKSIMDQDCKKYYITFIDDASNDFTGVLFKNLLHKINHPAKLITNKQRMGAAYNRFDAIMAETDPETVIVLLDMDDELLPGALSRVAQEYERGAWMTYGNWKNQDGHVCPVDLYFPKEVHEERSYRQAKYRSTHLRTFKRFLFDGFTQDDFKMDGEWLQTATEGPLMLGLLEMCGSERIGVIEDPIYLYRSNLPNNSQSRYGQEYKNEVYRQICQQPKKPLYEKKD